MSLELLLREELLSLQGTAKVENLCEQVIMKSIELPFEKLSGLATDGAPAIELKLSGPKPAAVLVGFMAPSSERENPN